MFESSPSRREGYLLMQNSISQIQADVSSMRGKYKAAVTHTGRSDISPVFSPGDSPGDDEHNSTPKQLQETLQEDRRALLRSRSPIRSVVGKPYSTPSTASSPPPSTHPTHDTVEFSSSDDGSDRNWADDQLITPRPKSSTSWGLDWTPRMVETSRSSPRSPTPAQFDVEIDSLDFPPPLHPSRDSAGRRETLSTTPSSLLEEAQMHRMVLRLEELFGNQDTQEQIRAAEATQRTTGSETRSEKLEQLTAEKSRKSSDWLFGKPPTPTVWTAAESDSAFAGLVPPYGEPYSPYSRRRAWAPPPSTDTVEADAAPTPTLWASHGNSRQLNQRGKTRKNNMQTRAPKAMKGAATAPERERAYPYDGAKTWRESCRVRGPLSRYPLHEAPTHCSEEVGYVKSGSDVEVLRTEIGRGFGSRDESPAMWVLLAQGGWLRVASQFCSPSYGEWLAQGGDGTGLTAPDRGPIAVLQTVRRPGNGAQFTSRRQSSTGSGERGSTPKRGSTRHTRPFYA